MMALDATDTEQIKQLPNRDTAIVVLEGVSMYLSNNQLHTFLKVLREKYNHLHILMDIYTEFGANASKYKNPVNDVGVTKLYGIDDIGNLLSGLELRFIKEHSLTPAVLVNELKPLDKVFFKLMFNRFLYRKIYRLIELGS